MDIKHYIAERLIILVAEQMGYNFSAERVSRIAEKSLELGNNGYATLLSTATAFDLDLLLYGDPKAKAQIKGVLK